MALRIEGLYLLAYPPNLNRIKRWWRFANKQRLYSTHYDTFAHFKASSTPVCAISVAAANTKWKR